MDSFTSYRPTQRKSVQGSRPSLGGRAARLWNVCDRGHGRSGDGRKFCLILHEHSFWLGYPVGGKTCRRVLRESPLLSRKLLPFLVSLRVVSGGPGRSDAFLAGDAGRKRLRRGAGSSYIPSLSNKSKFSLVAGFVCVVEDSRFSFSLLGWLLVVSSFAGARPLSSCGSGPWRITCRDGVGQGRFNKLAGLVEFQIMAFAFFLVVLVADGRAVDDFCSIVVVKEGRDILLRTSWWCAGRRIRRGSPDSSVVGDGSGIGDALGLSPADDLQWSLSRRASAGFPCGQQSVIYAMELFLIQAWLLLVFSSSGGFGGWWIRRRALGRTGCEGPKDRVVIFLYVRVFLLVFWVFSFPVPVAVCVCMCMYTVL